MADLLDNDQKQSINADASSSGETNALLETLNAAEVEDARSDCDESDVVSAPDSQDECSQSSNSQEEDPRDSDEEKLSLQERRRVQNKRAAIAVAIMAIVSILLIGGVKLMYLAADLSFNPAYSEDTIVDSTINKIGEKKRELFNMTPQDPFYVLLIGSDSRKGTAFYTGKADGHAQVDQHADVITLMRVDPVNYMITFVSVPRDTKLDGSKSKINDTLKKGKPTEVVKAVEKLTGEEIDYYMLVGFTGFEDLIDGIGGARVDVSKRINLTDPVTALKVTVEKGKNQLLDGSEALAFARSRKQFNENQDANRQVNVRSLESAIVTGPLERFRTNDASSIVDLLCENVSTNMDYDMMVLLVGRFMENSDNVTIYSCSGPYDGRIVNGSWIVPQDSEGWSRIMAAVDLGNDPNALEPASEEEENGELEAENQL